MGRPKCHRMTQDKIKNNIQVFLNISLKAQYNRTYPVLKMDDSVRTYIKPGSFLKGL